MSVSDAGSAAPRRRAGAARAGPTARQPVRRAVARVRSETRWQRSAPTPGRWSSRAPCPACSRPGGDIPWMATATIDEQLPFVALCQRTYSAFEELHCPVVIAIDGHCLGGGLELALCCDIRVAGRSAKLGTPEATIGLIPGAGGTQRLVRAVGQGVARDMLMTGSADHRRAGVRLGDRQPPGRGRRSRDRGAEARSHARRRPGRGDPGGQTAGGRRIPARARRRPRAGTYGVGDGASLGQHPGGPDRLR